jgi:arabinogalactan endo-1,4-beta-galactosidase
LEDGPGGIGFCYCGAEMTAYKGFQASDGSPIENQALFKFDNHTLPAFNVFKENE